MTAATANGAKGFSLVEVAVAAALLSTGLGGFSLLLTLAINGTAAAGHQSLAAAQVASMSEIFLLSGRSLPVAAETVAWTERIGRLLPVGRGTLCADSSPEDGSGDDPSCDGQGTAVIKVFWREAPVGDDDGTRRLVAVMPPP